MEFYLLNYFKPATHQTTALTEMGRRLMDGFGCTGCHRASLPIEKDRRVADVETRYDPTRGIFNRCSPRSALRRSGGQRGLPALASRRAGASWWRTSTPI
jgi:hypothetical protein